MIAVHDMAPSEHLERLHCPIETGTDVLTLLPTLFVTTQPALIAYLSVLAWRNTFILILASLKYQYNPCRELTVLSSHIKQAIFGLGTPNEQYPHLPIRAFRYDRSCDRSLEDVVIG